MQAIFNIPEICSRHDIRNVVISPGSRSAPITLAFARHPEFDCNVVGDERSAAFIAMGMALELSKPVALVCTSGSAVLNYYPAIAEAFYQKIPLLIITADRPPEWVDQMDGQTIRQPEIFHKHVKASFNLPVDQSHADAVWETERSINEAAIISKTNPQGPVHINVPLREPFYPDSPIKFDQNPIIIRKSEIEAKLTADSIAQLSNELKRFSKILIVSGQFYEKEPYLEESLENFCIDHGAVHISEILSNLITKNSIIKHELILGNLSINEKEQLRPELLITLGNSVLSKSLKNFLRQNKPKHHWRVQDESKLSDVFQCLSQIIPVKPSTFFNDLKGLNQNVIHKYIETWKEFEAKCSKHEGDFFKKAQDFSELKCIRTLTDYLPDESALHVSNSMPVRYLNYLGIPKNKNISVYSNRGTSGIDGSISTATGAAMVSNNIVTALTGDMAFFYDRNALWHEHKPGNLRIIILNNHGGGIFRMIDGPSSQPEVEEYFVTRQALNARHYASEFGLEYYFCNQLEDLEKHLVHFFEPSALPKILELETKPETDKTVFKEYKTIAKNDK